MIPLGDFHAGSVVEFKWNSQASDGSSITRGTNGTIRIYKDNSTTYRSSSAGITDTEDFNGVVGVHHLRIDTSDNADAGFYAADSQYQVVLVGAVVDGKTVNAVLVAFSIEIAYGAIYFLKIMFSDWEESGRLESILASRASQSAVNDVPTNAELAAALASADDATIAAIDAVQAHGDTAWATATGFSSLDAAGVRDAVGLAAPNLDTQLSGLVTNAELASALASLDVATLTALAAVQSHGDANWSTAAGFSVLDAGGVRDAVGLASANLDAQLANMVTIATLGSALGDVNDAVLDAIGALQTHGDSVWITATGFSTLDGGGVRGALGLEFPNLDDQLIALPTTPDLTNAHNATLAALAALQTHGDGSWATAVGFGTLDAFGVRTAVGLASANLDAQLLPLLNAPTGIKRNTAFAKFPFEMALASDHVTAASGLIVTVMRSIDGSDYEPCVNLPEEVGFGSYTIDLAAEDDNGIFVTLKFSAGGADTRTITIKTNA